MCCHQFGVTGVRLVKTVGSRSKELGSTSTMAEPLKLALDGICDKGVDVFFQVGEAIGIPVLVSVLSVIWV